MRFRIPKRQFSRRGAFSLVELMVVIVILALLSGIVALSVRTYLIRSKQSVAKVEISKLIQALDSFYASMDRYPTNEEGLAVLAEKSDAFPAGLVQAIPNDPWGNAYEYRSPGASDPYEILCFGGDKRQGGEGVDRDITSMDLLRAKKTP